MRYIAILLLLLSSYSFCLQAQNLQEIRIKIKQDVKNLDKEIDSHTLQAMFNMWKKDKERFRIYINEAIKEANNLRNLKFPPDKIPYLQNLLKLFRKVDSADFNTIAQEDKKDLRNVHVDIFHNVSNDDIQRVASTNIQSLWLSDSPNESLHLLEGIINSKKYSSNDVHDRLYKSTIAQIEEMIDSSLWKTLLAHRQLFEREGVPEACRGRYWVAVANSKRKLAEEKEQNKELIKAIECWKELLRILDSHRINTIPEHYRETIQRIRNEAAKEISRLEWIIENKDNLQEINRRFLRATLEGNLKEEKNFLEEQYQNIIENGSEDASSAIKLIKEEATYHLQKLNEDLDYFGLPLGYLPVRGFLEYINRAEILLNDIDKIENKIDSLLDKNFDYMLQLQNIEEILVSSEIEMAQLKTEIDREKSSVEATSKEYQAAQKLVIMQEKMIEIQKIQLKALNLQREALELLLKMKQIDENLATDRIPIKEAEEKIANHNKQIADIEQTMQELRKNKMSSILHMYRNELNSLNIQQKQLEIEKLENTIAGLEKEMAVKEKEIAIKQKNREKLHIQVFEKEIEKLKFDFDQNSIHMEISQFEIERAKLFLEASLKKKIQAEKQQQLTEGREKLVSLRKKVAKETIDTIKKKDTNIGSLIEQKQKSLNDYREEYDYRGNRVLMEQKATLLSGYREMVMKYLYLAAKVYQEETKKTFILYPTYDSDRMRLMLRQLQESYHVWQDTTEKNRFFLTLELNPYQLSLLRTGEEVMVLVSYELESILQPMQILLKKLPYNEDPIDDTLDAEFRKALENCNKISERKIPWNKISDSPDGIMSQEGVYKYVLEQWNKAKTNPGEIKNIKRNIKKIKSSLGILPKDLYNAKVSDVKIAVSADYSSQTLQATGIFFSLKNSSWVEIHHQAQRRHNPSRTNTMQSLDLKRNDQELFRHGNDGLFKGVGLATEWYIQLSDNLINQDQEVNKINRVMLIFEYNALTARN